MSAVVPNTIASDFLGAELTRYSRIRYGGSRDRVRVWQLSIVIIFDYGDIERGVVNILLLQEAI